jgi:YegS/Rv2252/BmrU family lipid kinase
MNPDEPVVRSHARRALLLVNPSSRRGADEDLQEGLDLLAEGGIDVIQQQPDSAEHMDQLIRKYKDQVDLYMLGGGDGTISAAASALYDCGKPFAVLPLGTANDLARSIGLPQQLSDVFRLIAADRRRRIDLGSVNGRHFFNVAHIGLGVHITYELTPEIKKRLGVFSYLQAFVRALSRKQTFRVFLQVDDRNYRQKSIHLAVGNGRFYGGGNVVDERAQIDSGELYLYSLKPQSVWELLTLAPLLRGGRQRLVERTFTAIGRRIVVKTTRPREIHADGEPAGFTPAVFEVLPNVLEVFAEAPESAQDIPSIETGRAAESSANVSTLTDRETTAA